MQVKMAFTLGSSGISNQWVLVLFLLMCSINKCFYLESYCLHWKEHTRKFRNIWPSYKVKQLVFHPRFFFPSEHPLRTSLHVFQLCKYDRMIKRMEYFFFYNFKVLEGYSYIIIAYCDVHMYTLSVLNNNTRYAIDRKTTDLDMLW